MGVSHGFFENRDMSFVYQSQRTQYTELLHSVSKKITSQTRARRRVSQYRTEILESPLIFGNNKFMLIHISYGRNMSY